MCYVFGSCFRTLAVILVSDYLLSVKYRFCLFEKRGLTLKFAHVLNCPIKISVLFNQNLPKKSKTKVQKW